MDLLVDSQSLFRFANDVSRLSPTALAHPEDANNRPFVSAATIWEFSIKIQTGKLSFPVPLDEFARSHLGAVGAQVIGINEFDAIRAGELPMHHRDPFDRMIIAQAIARDLAIVTSDARLERYGVRRIW